MAAQPTGRSIPAPLIWLLFAAGGGLALYGLFNAYDPDAGLWLGAGWIAAVVGLAFLALAAPRRRTLAVLACAPIVLLAAPAAGGLAADGAAEGLATLAMALLTWGLAPGLWAAPLAVLALAALDRPGRPVWFGPALWAAAGAAVCLWFAIAMNAAGLSLSVRVVTGGLVGLAAGWLYRRMAAGSAERVAEADGDRRPEGGAAEKAPSEG